MVAGVWYGIRKDKRSVPANIVKVWLNVCCVYSTERLVVVNVWWMEAKTNRSVYCREQRWRTVCCCQQKTKRLLDWTDSTAKVRLMFRAWGSVVRFSWQPIPKSPETLRSLPKYCGGWRKPKENTVFENCWIFLYGAHDSMFACTVDGIKHFQ